VANHNGHQSVREEPIVRTDDYGERLAARARQQCGLESILDAEVREIMVGLNDSAAKARHRAQLRWRPQRRVGVNARAEQHSSVDADESLETAALALIEGATTSTLNLACMCDSDVAAWDIYVVVAKLTRCRRGCE
tara:strand:+ start:660 stop:1067 length:408 start_codon:yes stop_codon:yes gene_type:complete